MKLNDGNLILIDGHVHLHGNWHLGEFLEAGFENFRNVSQHYGNSLEYIGFLCLTEKEGERGFQRLEEILIREGSMDVSQLEKVRLYGTMERVSLKVVSEEKDTILVIAGRQIVTRENLEVLALGTLNDFENGSPINELMTEIVEAGAVPVIPWGFGKWAGRRGKLLRDIVESPRQSLLFLGDNANRLRLWPRPALLERAEEMKIRNLPGTDPLPLEGENRRPGSYGLSLRGSVCLDTPWKDLKMNLTNPDARFEYFGTLETPFRFIRNQFVMLYTRHFTGQGSARR